MKIPKVEYEIFDLNQDYNLIQLDLSVCEGVKIILSTNVELSDNIDKHNSSSGYYNDYCYTTTSKYGTDISLKDRRKEFIDNNMTICEENCDLIGYDYYYKKAKCSCEIKIKLPILNEIKFDKERLKNNFKDINNIMNLQFLKCYKVVFKKENIIHNLGFYILGSIVCLFLICLFLFCFKFYIILVIKINTIFLDSKNDNNPNNDNNNKKIGNLITSGKNDILKIEEPNTINNNIINDINNNNTTDKKTKKIIVKKKKKKKIKMKKKNKINEIKINLNKGMSDILPIKLASKEVSSNLNINNEIYNNQNINNKDTKNSSLDYNDTELNSLSYDDALKHDQRTFIEYYIINNYYLNFNQFYFFKLLSLLGEGSYSTNGCFSF